mgnify:FL=1|jgi:CRISPR-associated exonuclease Cas4
MKEITGIMVYYYFICKKKLWYFANQIQMEQNSELVEIGKIIDETSYENKKKHILIDNTINIDFIKNGAILNEVKKTKSIEEASIWQVKYYMYYLEQKGVKNVKAKIDFPLIKETKDIILNGKDRQVLQNVIENIKKIINSNISIDVMQNKKCKKCAYYDLCYI